MSSALAVLLLLAAGQPPPLRSPIEPEALWKAFLAGDLVTVERGRALRVEAGLDVEGGSLGLLHDLSRFVRCLPLGPVPKASEPYAAARRLLRLERLRLEQLMSDGRGEALALTALFGDPPLYQTAAARQPSLVRWPVEQERWPGEVIEGVVEPRACPQASGTKRARDPKRRPADERERAKLLRQWLSAALGDLSLLPGETAGLLAYAYLRDAEQDPKLVLPAEWALNLEQALGKGAPPHRSAGRLLLARLLERDGSLSAAEAAYRAVLDDPGHSAEEDGRVRVRLAAMLEPRWEEVLRFAAGAETARPADRQVLAYAEARALYALGRFEDLRSFGRRWLLEAHPPGLLEDTTKDLLARLALVLEPPEALEWIRELGPDEEVATQARMDQIGQLAVESGRVPLAIAIYDRLRVGAAAARTRAGPSAAADEARWIAQRARIEFALEDPAGFAAFSDDLLRLATREQQRPLARYAPHREVARLAQDLMGRLTNEVPKDPERRKFAALLLEACVQLARGQSRWKSTLEAQIAPLTVLAGPYAAGRDGKSVKDPRAPQAKEEEARQKKKKTQPVKQLGEVVVPRLPPRIDAPDVPTALPAVTSLMVYEQPGAGLVAGVPWAKLAARRDKK